MFEQGMVMDPAGDPEVTVVVPVRNREHLIGDCVSSLLALRDEAARTEILIVDNASTDGTLESLKKFGREIRCLSEITRGASAARNRGVRAARGRFILFTDSDCVVERGWLGELIRPLRDPLVGVVGGRILSLPGANRIARFGERIHDQQRAIETEEHPYVDTGSWGSRRDLLIDVGLFDETLLRGQDVDLSWRILHAGYRLLYAPKAVVRHRNEETLWGLIDEGYVHGLNGVRVANKHAAHWPQVRRHWTKAGTRLSRDIQSLGRRPDLADGMLELVFDVGKSAGELVALARG